MLSKLILITEKEFSFLTRAKFRTTPSSCPMPDRLASKSCTSPDSMVASSIFSTQAMGPSSLSSASTWRAASLLQVKARLTSKRGSLQLVRDARWSKVLLLSPLAAHRQAGKAIR
ncbi:hypothetical protein GOODEAATRI_026368 [Goodea atripinnis]|uniref:Uncharacterized protein n=1 Tax=Goodea atripinnis TaxID=208336 RepID=A0ABV0MKZ4_9TELE